MDAMLLHVEATLNVMPESTSVVKARWGMPFKSGRPYAQQRQRQAPVCCTQNAFTCMPRADLVGIG